MKHKIYGDVFVMRFFKGEEIIKEMTDFLNRNKIMLASFSGIGAASSAILGFYSLKDKKYSWKEFTGEYEIISITGNVSLLDGKPFVHAHIMICDSKHNCFGGHLKEAVMGATAEIVLKPIKGKIERKLDEEIGLNLLDL